MGNNTTMGRPLPDPVIPISTLAIRGTLARTSVAPIPRRLFPANVSLLAKADRRPLAPVTDGSR